MYLFLIFFWLLFVIGDKAMKKLKIDNSSKSNDTITRTIRISGKTFDKILKCVYNKNRE